MKYAIIREQRSMLLSVELLCGVFLVSRSGFYKWNKKCSTSKSSADEQNIEANVIRVHFDSRRLYGYRKVQKKLEAEGFHVSDKQVYKIMGKNGLRAKTKKAFKPKTTDSSHSNKISPRVFQIESTVATKPNEIWVGDITYVATHEGWLYLSIFLDLFSRMVVGRTNSL